MRNLIAVLLLAPLAALRGGDAPNPASKPNVVILLADDMGYGDPRCYNPNSKIATPNIDRLARDGMRFTDAHAPGPLCHPSRYGLMTGRYPFRTDVSRWPTQPLIEKGQMTIATLLRDQGYHTAMVGKWHLGIREDGYDQPLRGGPLDCGFDPQKCTSERSARWISSKPAQFLVGRLTKPFRLCGLNSAASGFRSSWPPPGILSGNDNRAATAAHSDPPDR